MHQQPGPSWEECVAELSHLPGSKEGGRMDREGLGKEGAEKWALELGGVFHGQGGGAACPGTREHSPAADWSPVRALAEWERDRQGGLTFLVAVELVLGAVLGLLNDQFPRLDINFELQLLRNPQRL